MTFSYKSSKKDTMLLYMSSFHNKVKSSLGRDGSCIKYCTAWPTEETELDKANIQTFVKNRNQQRDTGRPLVSQPPTAAVETAASTLYTVQKARG